MRLPSSRGLNLLNSGAIQIGTIQVAMRINPIKKIHAKNHQYVPALAIRVKTTHKSGIPIARLRRVPLKKSIQNNFNIFKDFNGKLDYVYTDDVFELKANNSGLKMVESDYVILVQDDMVIKEKNFDLRMLKPFQEFSDVFAVTSQTAHNNRIIVEIILVLKKIFLSFSILKAKGYCNPLM